MRNLDDKLISHLKSFTTSERIKLFEQKVEERTKYITIVLENIFQEHNTSACIRSADCFGIQDVHIIENNNTFKDNSHISMGASKWLNIKRYNEKENNTKATIQKLRKKGYQIAATTPHNSDLSLFNLDIKQKTAIIFGSEHNGCSNIALDEADIKINIPMYGFTESFNISVAVALCLQELSYKIRKTEINWKLGKKEKNEVILAWLRNSIKSSNQIEELFKKHNLR